MAFPSVSVESNVSLCIGLNWIFISIFSSSSSIISIIIIVDAYCLFTTRLTATEHIRHFLCLRHSSVQVIIRITIESSADKFCVADRLLLFFSALGVSSTSSEKVFSFRLIESRQIFVPASKLMIERKTTEKENLISSLLSLITIRTSRTEKYCPSPSWEIRRLHLDRVHWLIFACDR